MKTKTVTTTAAKRAAANSMRGKSARAGTAAQTPPSAHPATPAKAARPGPGPRADLGAPIDSFFTRRSGPLRQVLDELRALIDAELPAAASSIKWGMPFYTLAGKPVCALAAFKAHVNLILAGPEGTFVDPDGLLEGDGKTGRHLKLRTPGEIPRSAVRAWLQAAAALARATP
jgi:hypothetical protein